MDTLYTVFKVGKGQTNGRTFEEWELKINAVTPIFALILSLSIYIYEFILLCSFL